MRMAALYAHRVVNVPRFVWPAARLGRCGLSVRLAVSLVVLALLGAACAPTPSASQPTTPPATTAPAAAPKPTTAPTAASAPKPTTAPAAAAPSTKKPVTVGLALIGQIGPVVSLVNGFKEEMANEGFVEGTSITYLEKSAQGDS